MPRLAGRATEHVHEHAADSDQRHAHVADDGYPLMEKKIRGDGGGDDADAAPDGIGDGEVDFLHGLAEAQIADDVSGHAKDGRQQPGKTICVFQHGGGENLGGNGEKKKYIGHSGAPSLV